MVVTAGSYDILVEAVAEDNDALLQFLSERLRKIPGVRETETFVYLRLMKQSYQWGNALAGRRRSAVMRAALTVRAAVTFHAAVRPGTPVPRSDAVPRRTGWGMLPTGNSRRPG